MVATAELRGSSAERCEPAARDAGGTGGRRHGPAGTAGVAHATPERAGVTDTHSHGGRVGQSVVRALALVILAPAALGIVPSRARAQYVVEGDRAVAYTFDDLPATRFTSLDDARSITTRLLAHIRGLRLPAIGFVNEGKLSARPGEEGARAALLDAWLDAGLDLGNHTYSHLRLYDATLADFQADVLRGEQATRRLMAARGRHPRYFRHPTLNTGRDLATKRALERFLADNGYTVAPVTIDSDEYLYALAYDRARARGDSMMMDRLGHDYLRYMREIFGFYEQLSQSLLGREPAQVLLLHANALNADWLDELAAMIAGRGYRAVPLDEALADSAYGLPDEYVGPRGPSWLERWARTQGREVGAPPDLPRWVRDAGR
jgi:peptidoglycan/xylan/chitin deacetylase (PgdA/CDA1 family)